MTLTDAYAMAKRVKGEAFHEMAGVVSPAYPDEHSDMIMIADALSDAWEVHGPNGEVWK